MLTVIQHSQLRPGIHLTARQFLWPFLLMIFIDMPLSIAHHIPMFYNRWGRLRGVAVWSAKKKRERTVSFQPLGSFP